MLHRRSRDRPAAAEVPTEAVEEPEASRSAVYSPKAIRLAIWAIGLSGFCALALEVFWTMALVFFYVIRSPYATLSGSLCACPRPGIGVCEQPGELRIVQVHQDLRLGGKRGDLRGSVVVAS